VEVYSRIHKVLDLGVNLNPRASPAPLQEGVTNARVLGVALESHKMLTHLSMWQGEGPEKANRGG
jgi:hypothetical protein